METKLKALKVVDLKNILSSAAVSVPAKSTKPDLVARILASQPALNAYHKLYPSSAPSEDLLAPPDDLDWNAEQNLVSETPKPSVVPKPNPIIPVSNQQSPVQSTTTIQAKLTVSKLNSIISPPEAPTKSSITTNPIQETNPAQEVDSELEKRKQRAARFGIPLVESSKSKQTNKIAKTIAVGDDVEKIQARAARFGIIAKDTSSTPSNRKRRSPAIDQIDTEESERRRKRAERFGLASPSVRHLHMPKS